MGEKHRKVSQAEIDESALNQYNLNHSQFSNMSGMWVGWDLDIHPGYQNYKNAFAGGATNIFQNWTVNDFSNFLHNTKSNYDQLKEEKRIREYAAAHPGWNKMSTPGKATTYATPEEELIHNIKMKGDVSDFDDFYDDTINARTPEYAERVFSRSTLSENNYLADKLFNKAQTAATDAGTNDVKLAALRDSLTKMSGSFKLMTSESQSKFKGLMHLLGGGEPLIKEAASPTGVGKGIIPAGHNLNTFLSSGFEGLGAFMGGNKFLDNILKNNSAKAELDKLGTSPIDSAAYKNSMDTLLKYSLRKAVSGAAYNMGDIGSL